MAEEKGPVEKALYIFALGLATYFWWRITAGIKKKIVE